MILSENVSFKIKVGVCQLMLLFLSIDSCKQPPLKWFGG